MEKEEVVLIDDKLSQKIDLIFMLYIIKGCTVIILGHIHNLLFGKQYLEDLTMIDRESGLHIQKLKEWIIKLPWQISIILLWEFAPTKEPIVLILSTKNGKKNSISAYMMKIRLVEIEKITGVILIWIAIEANAVVLLHLMTAMVSKMENLVFATIKTHINGQTTLIIKDTIHLAVLLAKAQFI